MSENASHNLPPAQSAAHQCEQRRVASFRHEGHAWRFVWTPGDEGAVIGEALRLARKGAPGLDSVGVALLAQHIGKHLRADQTSFLGALQDQINPQPCPDTGAH